MCDRILARNRVHQLLTFPVLSLQVFGPRLFGNKVAPGNGRISRTIPTRDHPTERAVGPARLRIRIQYSADEILSLCADIGMAWMWNAHPKKLKDLERGKAKAEGKHILMASEEMLRRKPLDISRIVELPCSFQGDIGGIVLPQTFEAAASRRRHVSLPCTAQESCVARAGRDSDTSIDHRNQMCESNEIKDEASPRAVYAAKENIAIKCLLEPFWLNNAKGKRIDRKSFSAGAILQMPGHHVDFKIALASILSRSVQQPVQIYTLNNVEVEEPNVGYSHAGQRFRHN